MDKKSLIFLFVFLSLLLSFIEVEAPVPFQASSTESGCEIEFPKLKFIKQNMDFNFAFHVFNGSSGKPIDFNDYSCFFHLYSKEGVEVFANESLINSSYFDIEIFMDGANFSEVGSLGYIMQCNSSCDGCFISNPLIVNPTGTEQSTANSIIYSLMLITSLFFTVLAFVGAIAINGKNVFRASDLIEVNFNKYYKLALFLLGYICLIFDSYFAWVITEQFVLVSFGASIFHAIFLTLIILFGPMIILIIIFALIQWLADTNLHKLSLRGLSKR